VLFRDNRSHSGAAIHIHDASPTIEHSRFEDNVAEIQGGAITIQSGLPQVLASSFLRNRAALIQGQGGAGGAIFLLSGKVTVEDGLFEGNSAEFDGGAIQAESDFVIRRSTFAGNHAATGGALRAESAFGFLTIEDSTFTGNFTTTTTRTVCDPFPPICYPIQYGGTGGALYDHESGVQVYRSAFDANLSRWGAAVYVDRASTRLEDSTFSDNVATLYGGAVHSSVGAPVIERSTFSGNEGSYGGAVYVEAQLSGQQSIRIRDSLFEGNRAISSGGAVAIAVAYGEIERSRFLDNEADGSGGAIFAYDNTGVQTPFTFRNVLLAGNRASNGGGMANSSACIRATVVNATFADNAATVQGGAVDNAACAASTYTNSVFWGDAAPISAEIAGAATVTYSDVQGGFAGTGNIDQDPLFFAPAAADYRLDTGSPAIDAGTDAGAPADDLSGLPRPFDGDGNGIPVTDMGAYEYSGPLCSDADGDGVCDGVDVCTSVFDPDQADTDGDGFGNACDCDFDQDGSCSIADFNLFLPDFVSGTDAGTGTDMDGDGSVGIADFNLFLPGFAAGLPGPSGLVP
jgi:predicted outer membrane repeat protein